MPIPFELAITMLPQDEIRPDYLLALYSLVLDLPKPALILEIGCWLGQSTLMMACAGQGTDTHIISVDPVFVYGEHSSIKEPGRIFTYRSSLIALMLRIGSARLDGYISIVPEFSERLITRWDNRQLDFLLVDGERSPDAVSRDCFWMQHVKPGGYCAFDDWHLEPVRASVGKYMESHPEWEIFRDDATTPFLRKKLPE